MEHTSDSHPAVETLRSFFAAMHDWGAEMVCHHRAIDWDNVDEPGLERDRAEQRKKIEAIFNRFCEVGVKAERLEGTGLAFRNPPEYNLDHEHILSVSEKPGKLVIETKQSHGLGWRYKYELVPGGEGWRIRDNRKYCSDKNPSWRAHML